MDEDEKLMVQHLSQIGTQWTLVFQAHAGQPDEILAAQQALMLRYAGAVYRYLFRVLGDPHAADDLAQEFAYRFIRGDFRRADPERGRFRDFIKAAVRNLLIDYQRRKDVRPQSVPSDELQVAVPARDLEDLDRQFLESWRNELLSRAWHALAQFQDQTGQPFHTVLRARADRPHDRSAQLAEHLSIQLGKPVSVDGVRQTLHRAREKFADLLLYEVAQCHSIGEPTKESLQQELIDLGLLDYCRAALERSNLSA